MLKKYHKKKIYPHGGSHFSKRRSENNSYNRQSESYNRYQRNNSKNDIQSENDDTKVKSKEKLKTTLKNDGSKNNSKGRRSESHRDDPRRSQGWKREANRQKDRNKGINYTSSPLRYHVLYFHLDIYHSHFTPNIFNFNPFVSDHHVQIFTLGDLSDYKALYSRPINSAQAKATTKALASTDSI
jgi:hypothetical protein